MNPILKSQNVKFGSFFPKSISGLYMDVAPQAWHLATVLLMRTWEGLSTGLSKSGNKKFPSEPLKGLLKNNDSEPLKGLFKEY